MKRRSVALALTSVVFSVISLGAESGPIVLGCGAVAGVLAAAFAGRALGGGR